MMRSVVNLPGVNQDFLSLCNFITEAAKLHMHYMWKILNWHTVNAILW